MFKILFFISLFSLQAFAGAPLLQKNVRSEFVFPENYLEYNCSINSDRRIIVTKREGTYRPHTTVHRLTRRARNNLRNLVHFASSGSISDAPVRCDGGDQLVYGYHGGTKFIIDEDLDCGNHRVNQSRSVAKLKSLAEKYCRF